MVDQTFELWPTEPSGERPLRLPPKHEGLPKRVLATMGFLLGAVPRRRTGRLGLWVIVLLLAVGGIGMLVYPFYTHFYARQKQGSLASQFEATKSDATHIQAYKEQKIKVGEALTRLRIPKLRVNVIVVEGITGNALRAGAGHYPDTPLPGDFGNVAIAGHRTGFGEPFRHLERLRPGDQIILVAPTGTFTYEVVQPFDGHGNPWITLPTDLSVKLPTPEPSLTLTTCDPPHTSLNRLIVRAKLVKSEVVVQ